MSSGSDDLKRLFLAASAVAYNDLVTLDDKQVMDECNREVTHSRKR